MTEKLEIDKTQSQMSEIKQYYNILNQKPEKDEALMIRQPIPESLQGI